MKIENFKPICFILASTNSKSGSENKLKLYFGDRTESRWVLRFLRWTSNTSLNHDFPCQSWSHFNVFSWFRLSNPLTTSCNMAGIRKKNTEWNWSKIFKARAWRKMESTTRKAPYKRGIRSLVSRGSVDKKYIQSWKSAAAVTQFNLAPFSPKRWMLSLRAKPVEVRICSSFANSATLFSVMRWSGGTYLQFLLKKYDFGWNLYEKVDLDDDFVHFWRHFHKILNFRPTQIGEGPRGFKGAMLCPGSIPISNMRTCMVVFERSPFV